MDPFISVIIPTFHRPLALAETLTALVAQDYPTDRFEIVVIDDSGEAEAEAVVAQLEATPVPITVESPDHQGVTGARNLGARKARGDLLLFIDDDVVVAPDRLQRHRSRHLQLGPRVLLNGSWEYSPEIIAERQTKPFGRFRLRLERESPGFAQTATAAELIAVPSVHAGVLSLEASLFEELEGFDENIPSAGAEDQELSIRATAAGAKLYVDPTLVSIHHESWTNFRGFCHREERAAANIPYLARKHPARYANSAYMVENSRPQSGDSAKIVVKKVAKRLISSAIPLAVLHRAIDFSERLRLPDSLIFRCYRLALAAHINRGVRSGLTRGESPAQ